MTSMDSRWDVVVRVNLIQPLASWVTQEMLQSAVSKISKRETCRPGAEELYVLGCPSQA